ncbi:hypothetical protein J9174_02745 [Macrococcoides canis]|uniref:hypothetical protein n=1 Tax=Macrococcoides canis TaxID=1855823 RepID=UPI001AEC42D2|nr:hypothetical protein [Macrococcus canis]QTQ08612.1 hypothetical protein J9174_02745 [Macrococcus canis]
MEEKIFRSAKSMPVRIIESIEQDQSFNDMKKTQPLTNYNDYITECIEKFINSHFNFEELFTEQVYQFDISRLYDLVIKKDEVLKCSPKSKEAKNIFAQMNDTIINPILKEIYEEYEKYKLYQDKYHYTYVVQNKEGMLTVVGKSSFKINNNDQKEIDNENQGDLFEDISFWKNDINSIDDLDGTQHIEVAKYYIRKTGMNIDSEELDHFFKENKSMIKKYLRRLYKHAWVIPVKGDCKDAKKIEKYLGEYLLEQENIFISNKDSHLI